MFGSDEGIILSSAVGEVLGSTIGIYGGADLDSSDGSLMILMISQLRANCLRTHLDHTMELYWVILT